MGEEWGSGGHGVKSVLYRIRRDCNCLFDETKRTFKAAALHKSEIFEQNVKIWITVRAENEKISSV